MIFSDLALSKRLEKANAISNAKIAETYAKIHPKLGAAVLEIGGGYGIYLGENSPLTQALGMGLEQSISLDEIEALESFYFKKNSAVNIELSPYVEPTLLEILGKRGYSLVEVSNVLVKDLSKQESFVFKESEIEIVPVDLSTIECWANTLAKGFGVEGDFADLLKTVWQTTFLVPDNSFFLAKIDNNVAGGGAISIYEKIALFSGASTIPEFRKLGIQTKLLQHRLNFAIEQGCNLAVISTLPGTISERNAEHQGFQVVYTRVKLMRPFVTT